MDNLGIQNIPKWLWNCEKTELSHMVKLNRVITPIEKRFMYKRTYVDRSKSYTLLGCLGYRKAKKGNMPGEMTVGQISRGSAHIHSCESRRLQIPNRETHRASSQ